MDEHKKYLSVIDHTLLRADAKTKDIEKICIEAVEYGFYSVITQPYYVEKVSQFLNGTAVLCGTVISFPFGTDLTEVKEYQAERAVQCGAQEIDMVMLHSAFKNGNYTDVIKDIERVVLKAKVPVKVIIETSLLTIQEIVNACKLCIEGGAAFVKTSTGYIGGGASVENIQLMKKTCAGKIKIKASGGIKTFEDLKALISAGADRIGTSGGVNIANSIENTSGY